MSFFRFPDARRQLLFQTRPALLQLPRPLFRRRRTFAFRRFPRRRRLLRLLPPPRLFRRLRLHRRARFFHFPVPRLELLFQAGPALLQLPRPLFRCRSTFAFRSLPRRRRLLRLLPTPRFFRRLRLRLRTRLPRRRFLQRHLLFQRLQPRLRLRDLPLRLLPRRPLRGALRLHLLPTRLFRRPLCLRLLQSLQRLGFPLRKLGLQGLSAFLRRLALRPETLRLRRRAPLQLRQRPLQPLPLPALLPDSRLQRFLRRQRVRRAPPQLLLQPLQLQRHPPAPLFVIRLRRLRTALQPRQFVLHLRTVLALRQHPLLEFLPRRARLLLPRRQRLLQIPQPRRRPPRFLLHRLPAVALLLLALLPLGLDLRPPFLLLPDFRRCVRRRRFRLLPAPRQLRLQLLQTRPRRPHLLLHGLPRRPLRFLPGLPIRLHLRSALRFRRRLQFALLPRRAGLRLPADQLLLQLPALLLRLPDLRLRRLPRLAVRLLVDPHRFLPRDLRRFLPPQKFRFQFPLPLQRLGLLQPRFLRLLLRRLPRQPLGLLPFPVLRLHLRPLLRRLLQQPLQVLPLLLRQLDVPPQLGFQLRTALFQLRRLPFRRLPRLPLGLFPRPPLGLFLRRPFGLFRRARRRFFRRRFRRRLLPLQLLRQRLATLLRLPDFRLRRLPPRALALPHRLQFALDTRPVRRFRLRPRTRLLHGRLRRRTLLRQLRLQRLPSLLRLLRQPLRRLPRAAFRLSPRLQFALDFRPAVGLLRRARRRLLRRRFRRRHRPRQLRLQGLPTPLRLLHQPLRGLAPRTLALPLRLQPRLDLRAPLRLHLRLLLRRLPGQTRLLLAPLHLFFQRLVRRFRLPDFLLQRQARLPFRLLPRFQLRLFLFPPRLRFRRLTLRLRLRGRRFFAPATQFLFQRLTRRFRPPDFLLHRQTRLPLRLLPRLQLRLFLFPPRFRFSRLALRLRLRGRRFFAPATQFLFQRLTRRFRPPDFLLHRQTRLPLRLLPRLQLRLFLFPPRFRFSRLALRLRLSRRRFFAPATQFLFQRLTRHFRRADFFLHRQTRLPLRFLPRFQLRLFLFPPRLFRRRLALRLRLRRRRLFGLPPQLFLKRKPRRLRLPILRLHRQPRLPLRFLPRLLLRLLAPTFLRVRLRLPPSLLPLPPRLLHELLELFLQRLPAPFRLAHFLFRRRPRLPLRVFPRLLLGLFRLSPRTLLLRARPRLFRRRRRRRLLPRQLLLQGLPRLVDFLQARLRLQPRLPLGLFPRLEHLFLAHPRLGLLLEPLFRRLPRRPLRSLALLELPLHPAPVLLRVLRLALEFLPRLPLRVRLRPQHFLLRPPQLVLQLPLALARELRLLHQQFHARLLRPPPRPPDRRRLFRRGGHGRCRRCRHKGRDALQLPFFLRRLLRHRFLPEQHALLRRRFRRRRFFRLEGPGGFRRIDFRLRRLRLFPRHFRLRPRLRLGPRLHDPRILPLHPRRFRLPRPRPLPQRPLPLDGLPPLLRLRQLPRPLLLLLPLRTPPVEQPKQPPTLRRLRRFRPRLRPQVPHDEFVRRQPQILAVQLVEPLRVRRRDQLPVVVRLHRLHHRHLQMRRPRHVRRRHPQPLPHLPQFCAVSAHTASSIPRSTRLKSRPRPRLRRPRRRPAGKGFPAAPSRSPARCTPALPANP